MRNLITKIEIQKRNKNRVNIFINDEFKFSCSTELIYYHKLKNGESIDIDQLKEIVEEDNYIKAKDIALKYIERYFRSEKQIENKLIEKEFDNKIIERVVFFLKEYKFIDDENLCKMYIQDNKGKFGRLKLRNNLLNKGIREEIIQKYLDSISDDEISETVFKCAEKKYLQLVNGGHCSKVIYRKLGEYLLRQGFDFSAVKPAINKLLDSGELVEENSEKDLSKLEELMRKKYEALLKKESDNFIIKKKLFDYLLRKGYKYDDIKNSFGNNIERDSYEE